jgi:DMSO/TMAO reductase YedYZ molybdopterin-dependent catalytic subunit
VSAQHHEPHASKTKALRGPAHPVPIALHPQTILPLDFLGKPLEPEWGAPVRLRIPTKLGFKSAKNISAITVTNSYPGDCWEDQGYNWLSGS